MYPRTRTYTAEPRTHNSRHAHANVHAQVRARTHTHMHTPTHTYTDTQEQKTPRMERVRRTISYQTLTHAASHRLPGARTGGCRLHERHGRGERDISRRDRRGGRLLPRRALPDVPPHRERAASIRARNVGDRLRARSRFIAWWGRALSLLAGRFFYSFFLLILLCVVDFSFN